MFLRAGLYAKLAMANITKKIMRNNTLLLKTLIAGDFVLVIDDFHYINLDTQLYLSRILKAELFNGLKVILLTLPHRADDAINSSQKDSQAEKAAMHYMVTKERLNMYIKLRKSDSAKDQLNIMESQASQSGDENLKNDLLYTKAIYYYTFGMNAQGNAVFKEMANKLTASKEYDKVDEVYQTLISNGRKSNNANMVAQSYSNYIAWKDSTDALKHADEINALKKQIADVLQLAKDTVKPMTEEKPTISDEQRARNQERLKELMGSIKGM